MMGCNKYRVKSDWMKDMLNWDLFTHPNAEAFAENSSYEEKVNLSKEWKDFMDKKDIFISFYEWNIQRTFYIPRSSSRKVLKPITARPTSYSIQTLSIPDLGKEIGKLKKFIKEQESNIEQKEEQVVQIQHQKFHILIDLKIQGRPFHLKTLLDT